MSEEVKPGSSAPAGQVGDQPSGEPAGKETKQENEPQPKMVSWENHRRALDDMHKEKNLRRELEKKIGDDESERLKAQENFKGLYEREKTRADKAEEDAKKVTELYVNTQRYEKVRDHAIKQGLKPEAMADLNLLDTRDLEVESTSHGRFMVHGVETFVEQLKNSRSHWFQKATAPNINSAGGGATPPGNGTLSVVDVRMKERLASAGKIPVQEYYDTLKQYDKQQKEARPKT